MPTWQARCASLVIRIVVRRANWGGPASLVRRARRVFGPPRGYGWLAAVGLRRERAVGRVAGEWLRIANVEPGALLYIHGGGFVSCSPITHRPITAALARLTRRPVFSVAYRLAPEHTLGDALSDVVAAFDSLLQAGFRAGEIAIAGDSAGGNLALSLALALRDRGRELPACVIAFSPWTDLAGTGDSVRDNDGRCAMFRTANIADFAAVVLGTTFATDPSVSPVCANLDGLPPVLLHVGSTEILRDDSTRFAEGVRRAGGTAELRVFNDVPHGRQMLVGLIPEANESLRDAADFAKRHWSAAAPSH